MIKLKLSMNDLFKLVDYLWLSDNKKIQSIGDRLILSALDSRAA